MPAFYRMPVTYVLLLGLGGLFGLASWGHGRGRLQNEGPKISETSPPGEDRSREKPTPKSAPEPPPTDGILRTTNGLRRKVLVREPGLRHHDAPAGGNALGPEVGLYSIAYVYEESAEALRVGPPDGRVTGWLPASALIPWDTRLMVRPVSSDAAFFIERSCLLAYLAQRQCESHASLEPCPRLALHQNETDKDSPMGWPVLRAESIPQPSGPERTIFEVATLVREGAPAPDVRVSDADADALRDLYVAIVLATSPSMQPSIDKAKEVARRIAQEASARADVRLHLALVEYRDRRNDGNPEGFEFLTRITTGFVAPAEFAKVLEKVQRSNYRDNSMSERPLEGISVALPAPEGDPVAALSHLAWPKGRAGELAGKMIVLLGDTPDHERDPERVARLAQKARDAKITIASLTIMNPLLTVEERDRYRSQWRALADGSYRPLDKAAQFERPVPPLDLTLDQADKIVPSIQGLIDDRIRRALELARLARADAEGRLNEYQKETGLRPEQLAPVLADLRRAARPPETVIQEGPNKPPPLVERAWVAQRHNDKELLRLELLMSRDELDRLIEDLNAFHRAILSEATRHEDLIGLLGATASGERGFFGRDRGNETFADYLARSGLPPARPDSLLRRRQADLVQTDDLLRAELETAIARALTRLQERREHPEWSERERLVDKSMTWVPYAPLDF